MLATAFLPQVVGSGAAPGASYHRDIDIVTQQIKQQVTLCVFYMRFFYLIFLSCFGKYFLLLSEN